MNTLHRTLLFYFGLLVLAPMATAATMATPTCPNGNAIGNYIASKENSPIKVAMEESSKTTQNLNQRFTLPPGVNALSQKYKLDSILKDMQDFTELAKVNDPYNISLREVKGVNTLESTRDALNLLKKKADDLSFRIGFLAKNNSELRPLLQRPLNDLDRDRKNISRALEVFQKMKTQKNDAILSNIRMIIKEGVINGSAGSLGEFQIAARLPPGFQQGVRVGSLLRDRNGGDFVNQVRTKISPDELDKILDGSFTNEKNLSDEEKLRFLSTKEIDLRYTENTAHGPKEVWAEVKNINHEAHSGDITKYVNRGTYQTSLLNQLEAMKTSRDLMTRLTGQPIQLELVFVKGISPEARKFIDQNFPGVFRFR